MEHVFKQLFVYLLIYIYILKKIKKMEQDNNFAIQTSLINDRRNSSSIEVEQLGVEKNADGEPFWLQTLNLFGCLYPINIRNYKKWNAY